MDNHPDFIEARRIKKQNEDQLADINNKIASLESLGNDLKTQVETHFTALEEALSARKAVLLQNLNGKIASVGTYK
jgi:adenylosuccinate synthase